MPPLILERVEIVSTSLEVRASVALRLGELLLEAEAEAAATRDGVVRAVGLACLAATRQTMGPGRRLHLEHAERIVLGGRSVVLVLITLLSPRGARELPGAALDTGDVPTAAARAVLNALGAWPVSLG